MRTVLSLFVLTLSVCFASVALADVVPVAPAPETCTVDKKEQEGTVCEECVTTPSPDEPCEDQYEGTDFEYVCSSDGVSVWTEVWCDGPPREGCSMAGPGAASLVALLLAGLGLVAVRRRA